MDTAGQVEEDGAAVKERSVEELENILRAHPHFYDLCNQARAARGMRLDLDGATLLTFSLAGRLLLQFERAGGFVSFVTDARQPERVGLHSYRDITVGDAQVAIGAVLESTAALVLADMKLADAAGVPLW